MKCPFCGSEPKTEIPIDKYVVEYECGTFCSQEYNSLMERRQETCCERQIAQLKQDIFTQDQRILSDTKELISLRESIAKLRQDKERLEGETNKLYQYFDIPDYIKLSAVLDATLSHLRMVDELERRYENAYRETIEHRNATDRYEDRITQLRKDFKIVTDALFEAEETIDELRAKQ